MREIGVIKKRRPIQPPEFDRGAADRFGMTLPMREYFATQWGRQQNMSARPHEHIGVPAMDALAIELRENGIADGDVISELQQSEDIC